MVEAEDKKIISTGCDDFKEMIDKDFYFVDKSLMIRELLDSGAKSMLVTRPKGFGKTLNLSMIRRFFEDERTEMGAKIDNAYLFRSLAIADCSEEYLRHRQQYPVISLSLNLERQPDFELAYGEVKQRIAEEFSRHQYVLNGQALYEREKRWYRAIQNCDADESLYWNALEFLSRCLDRYHGKRALILIDDYDVLLENAYAEGFYDEMFCFTSCLFDSALKTNPCLERGLLTGCLQIGSWNEIVGLNNLLLCPLNSPYYAVCFGFTEEEVKRLLAYYKLDDRYEELQRWYGGYRFANTEIFNPGSLMNRISAIQSDGETSPRVYWAGTVDNCIIDEMIENADCQTKSELETLMTGGAFEKPEYKTITFEELYQCRVKLWNHLLFTGYLKCCGERLVDLQIYVKVAIPNQEIRSIFEHAMLRRFDRKMKYIDRSPLISALEEGDCEAAEDFISDWLMDTIKYFDYTEGYYRRILAGLLQGMPGYRVCSNRESGNGRPDLLLRKTGFSGKIMILELKVADSVAEMEQKCDEALAQIRENKYDAPFLKEGYAKAVSYGICFYKKECMMKQG